MSEEKEKRKNDFDGSREFLLDPRYKAFVAGKSNKLYWSRENNELSIVSNLMLISGFVGIFLFGWGAWATTGDAYVFENGEEVSATVINCQAINYSDKLDLDIRYEVNDIIYDNNNVVFRADGCLEFPLGSQTTIRYIDPTKPLLTANAQNYRWSLAYSFQGCVGIYSFVFVGFAIHELRNFRKFRKLSKDGVIIDGQLENWVKDVSSPSIIYSYKFQSPSEKWITGKRKRCSKDAILPEAGTPVNILYADDDCHMLL